MRKHSKRNLLISAIAIAFAFNALFCYKEHRALEVSVAGDETIHAIDDKAVAHLKILTLGGSVTWGAFTTENQNSYPYLLENEGHSVFNLAIRGSGSSFPAQCIDSMLKEHIADEVSFDVVMMEFSINGLVAFELLLLRLKERYPEALFIYVDLISMTKGQFTDPKTRKLMEDIGVSIYEFPRSKDPEERKVIELFYASDQHHLADSGHELVKKSLTDIISHQSLVSKPKLGSWLGGDNCRNWLMSGDMKLDYTGDAEVSEYDTRFHKHALEVKNGGVTIEYDHAGDYDASISLGYLTKCSDFEDKTSTIYPPVVVRIEQSEEKVQEAKDSYANKEFQISRRDFDHVDYITDGWTFISGLHRIAGSRRSFHIMGDSTVGIVKPGRNFIIVQPIEEKSMPFRIAATIVCEACKRLGWEHGIAK